MGYSLSPWTAGKRIESPPPLLKACYRLFCSLNIMMLAYPLYATFFNTAEEGEVTFLLGAPSTFYPGIGPIAPGRSSQSFGMD